MDSKDNLSTKPLELSVLIADDEEDLCNLIKDLIENQQDLNIKMELSYDGKSALSLIENKNIDLLITDIGMPHIDGQKLIHLISQMPVEKRPSYILVLSGNLILPSQYEINLRKINYMEKPFKISNLLTFFQKVYKEKLKLHSSTFLESVNAIKKEEEALKLTYEKTILDELDSYIRSNK